MNFIRDITVVHTRQRTKMVTCWEFLKHSRRLVIYFNKELNIHVSNAVRGSEMHTAKSLVSELTFNEVVISVGKVSHRSSYSWTIPSRRQDSSTFGGTETYGLSVKCRIIITENETVNHKVICINFRLISLSST